MRKNYFVFCISFFLLGLYVGLAQADVGHVIRPLELNQKFIALESDSYFNEGGGTGMMARYTQRIFPYVIFESGMGITGGKKQASVFVAGDLELVQDYLNNPRVSIKASLSHHREKQGNFTEIGATPIVSKGFYIGNYEIFPGVGLPFSVALSHESDKFLTRLQGTLGLFGAISVGSTEEKKWWWGVQGSANLQNSYGGVLLSLGLPL